MKDASGAQSSAKAAKTLRLLAVAFAAGDLRGAEVHWLLLSMQLPDHPQTLHWQGQLRLASRQPTLAADAFAAALRKQPNEPATLIGLATALAAMNEWETANTHLQQAASCTDTAAGWLQLALAFDAHGNAVDALSASEKAIALDPSLAKARLMRARTLQMLGDSDGAATEFRRVLGNRQTQAAAWFGLLDLKSIPLVGDELIALQRCSAASHPPADKLLLEFALATAYEAAGHYPQAAATFLKANQHASTLRPWSPTRLRRDVDETEAAFRQSTRPRDHGKHERVGSQVIFVTGLPRSGTTLFEQILAAHPRVSASGELPYLEQVLARESLRRGQTFPRWVADCPAADWARLGEEYLRLTARFRNDHAVMTDKAPNNWLLAGAAMAMLPGARFLHCHRDAVETCWSCFKQLFGPDQAHFSYDFDHLADFWRASEQLSRFWESAYPEQFSRRCYENLLADPEAETRALLTFCGLDFDEACLRPHLATRSIRTPSAAQVRQPIRRSTSRASQYGSALDPLRLALARVGYQSPAEAIGQGLLTFMERPTP
ncbi:MAG: sulfotransferase [Pseudomarimonas sp.]